jgi:chromosome segregation ATPase
VTAKTKTKRDRAAGRHRRHTAIQAIVNNHNGIIDDIASIDNSIASLQDETCDLGSRLDAWYDRLNQADKNNRACVAHAMQRIVENERKAAEVESAVAILQHTSKEHRKAIAQLIACTNKVHGKQTAFNQEITLLQAEVDDTNRRLFQLAWINLGIWFAATLTIFILLITAH